MTKNNLPEETLNASTLLLFSLFIISTFCSILSIDEKKITEGIILGSCGLAFLLLTIWSNRSRFYPTLVGFLVYIILTITFVYFFPKIIVEGVGIGILSPYLYLMLIFLVFLYLISQEYQKYKSAGTDDTQTQ